MKPYKLFVVLLFSLLFGCAAGPTGPRIDSESTPVKLTSPLNVVIYWDGTYSISVHNGSLDEETRSAAESVLKNADEFGKYKAQVVDSLRKQGLAVRLAAPPLQKTKGINIIERDALVGLSGSTLFFNYRQPSIICGRNLLQFTGTNLRCSSLEDRYAEVNVSHFKSLPNAPAVLVWRESFSSTLGPFGGGCGEDKNCVKDAIAKLISKMKEKAIL